MYVKLTFGDEKHNLHRNYTKCSDIARRRCRKVIRTNSISKIESFIGISGIQFIGKMSSILRVTALTLLRNSKFNLNAICAPAVKFSSSTGSDDSNHDGPPKGKDKSKNDEASKAADKSAEADDKSKLGKSQKSTDDRLNDLLNGLDFEPVFKNVKKIETAKPKGYRTIKEKKISKEQLDPRRTQNIDEAATQVAESFGGDTKKTKTELLSKLKSKTDSGFA